MRDDPVKKIDEIACVIAGMEEMEKTRVTHLLVYLVEWAAKRERDRILEVIKNFDPCPDWLMKDLVSEIWKDFTKGGKGNGKEGQAQDGSGGAREGQQGMDCGCEG